jgi:hypothetical protein
MRKSLGSQIPDTAPCNRLLHRGGRSVLRSPILKCRPNLRVLPAGGVKGSASARARSREDSFGLFAVNAGQNGGGHVQEQSTGEGSEHGGLANLWPINR